MSGEIPAPSVGSRLIAAGWRQGSLFEAPSVRFQFNELESPDAELLTRPNAVKERFSKLVLITQTCDIRSENEARVEALICKVSANERLILHADGNAIRWFLIDRGTGLVAYAAYRMLIDKRALLYLNPEPWPGNEARFDRFKRWLARRYDRPALPDPLVECFQRPLEITLGRFAEENPELARSLSEAVHEFRVSMPSGEDPPFDLRLLILIRREMSRDQADALEAAIEGVRRCLDPATVNLVGVIPATDEEVSIADYYATRPLFLECLTYRGEEVEGAEPFGRT